MPPGTRFTCWRNTEGLLGGLYISPQFSQRELAEKLLKSTIETLRAIPLVERVEAQLIPFGCNFDEALAGRGFRLYPRQFLLLDLQGAAASSGLPRPRAGPAQAGAASGLKLERWNDRYFARVRGLSKWLTPTTWTERSMTSIVPNPAR